MDKKFSKNVITGFGSQLIIIILGFIVPRIMITSYGSDINGLVSTVGQIFMYLNLLEAGIGQAAKVMLYKPILNNDQEQICYYAAVARKYFRRVTVVYAICVLAFALSAPFILKTSTSYMTAFLIIILEGMSSVLSFCFIQTQNTILVADGHGYINNGVNVVNKTLSYAVKIILASMGFSIVYVQLAYFLITVGKVFYYNSYFKKNYDWLHYPDVPNTVKLENRNSFVLTELASTVFSSTDLIVLSSMFSTQLSSVYTVNSMAFSHLNMLLTNVYSSINYLLGRTYHEDLKKYEKTHDAFISVFMGIITVFMATAYTLCIPFVRLYTKGVTDVQYIYPSLPLMFCMVQLLSWSRYVQGYLTGVAGYAKEVSRVSILEAFLNVSLSIILSWRFGIVGVLAATVIALPLKVVYCTYIADRLVLKRSYARTVSILGINYLFFAAVVAANRFFTVQAPNYMVFLAYGIVFFAGYFLIGAALNLLVNKDCMFLMKQILKRKK